MQICNLILTKAFLLFRLQRVEKRKIEFYTIHVYNGFHVRRDATATADRCPTKLHFPQQSFWVLRGWRDGPKTAKGGALRVAFVIKFCNPLISF